MTCLALSPSVHLPSAMAIAPASSRKVTYPFSSYNMIGDTPAPTAYKPQSDFDQDHPHGRKFSFGIAREAYSKVYVKENPVSDKSIPGPGTYTVPQKVGNEAKKFSMKGRTLNHCKLPLQLTFIVMLTTTRANPGPGAYDPKTMLSPNGSYYVAGIHNSKSHTFSLPSLPRFRQDKQDQKPGPGAYSLKAGMSDSASSFISTFKSPKTRTFYHSDRKTIDISKDTRSKIIQFIIAVQICLVLATTGCLQNLAIMSQRTSLVGSKALEDHLLKLLFDLRSLNYHQVSYLPFQVTLSIYSSDLRKHPVEQITTHMSRMNIQIYTLDNAMETSGTRFCYPK